MTQKRTIAQAIENLTHRNATSAPPRIIEQKRTGRPTNEAGHIALLAHCHMCRHEISGVTSVQRMRNMAATALHRGNDDAVEDQERNARRDIAKAEGYLQGEWVTLTFAGDGRGGGRAWLAVQREHEGITSFIEHHGDGRVDVLGFGWLCEWGERRARYGLIQSRPGVSTSIITVSQGEGVKK